MSGRKEDFDHLRSRADGTGRRHDMARKNPCAGCYYHGGKAEAVKCCNYYLITGIRRPCEAGHGCTVRQDGRRLHKIK